MSDLLPLEGHAHAGGDGAADVRVGAADVVHPRREHVESRKRVRDAARQVHVVVAEQAIVLLILVPARFSPSSQPWAWERCSIERDVGPFAPEQRAAYVTDRCRPRARSN